MDFTSLGLAGLGFWLAVAAVVIGYIWSGIQKDRMKHELTLKLLEKGQGVDQELLAKLLASDKPAVVQKSVAEQHRDGGGIVGFTFLVAGLMFAFIGIIDSSPTLVPGTLAPAPGGGPLILQPSTFVDSGPSWLLIGLGVFAFVFGYLVIRGSIKEYEKAKAEEKLSRS